MIRPLLVVVVLSAAVLLAACSNSRQNDDDSSAEVAAATLTVRGQPAPDFALPTLDGEVFRLSDQRGKVVLVNFFATWCPPCIDEMPHLQDRVWQRFAGDRFAMVSVARQETIQVVAPFVRERGLSWTFALDAQREAFALYAKAYIPRNYVIDAAGEIVYQSQGFAEDDFAQMVATITRELAADAAAGNANNTGSTSDTSSAADSSDTRAPIIIIQLSEC